MRKFPTSKKLDKMLDAEIKLRQRENLTRGLVSNLITDLAHKKSYEHQYEDPCSECTESV